VLGEMRSWSWSWYIYLGNGDGWINALSGYTSVDVHWTNTQSYRLWVYNQLFNKRNGNTNSTIVGRHLKCLNFFWLANNVI
jgi:hypothetical protein